jgi:hypothetical protein
MNPHRQVLSETLVKDALLVRVDMGPSHTPDLPIGLDQIREAVVSERRDDDAGYTA